MLRQPHKDRRVECLIESDSDPEESEAERISVGTFLPHLRIESRREVVDHQVSESIDESEGYSEE